MRNGCCTSILTLRQRGALAHARSTTKVPNTLRICSLHVLADTQTATQAPAVLIFPRRARCIALAGERGHGRYPTGNARSDSSDQHWMRSKEGKGGLTFNQVIASNLDPLVMGVCGSPSPSGSIEGARVGSSERYVYCCSVLEGTNGQKISLRGSSRSSRYCSAAPNTHRDGAAIIPCVVLL